MKLREIHPNWITSIRLVLAPVALYLQQTNSTASLMICIAVMTVAELSDTWDGRQARRYGMVTKFGKLYDPMCDSIFHQMLFIGLLASHSVPLLPVVIIVARDLIISYVRVINGLNGVAFGARLSGKFKTSVQGIALFLIILSLLAAHFGLPSGIAILIAAAVAWIAAAATLVSMVDYLFVNWHLIKPLFARMAD